jgi:hypothetical protein
MNNGRVKAQWDEFYRLVLKPIRQPAANQIQEMRRAFYAGVEAMMKISMEVAELDEDSAETELQMVEQELKDFGHDVQRGKA